MVAISEQNLMHNGVFGHFCQKPNQPPPKLVIRYFDIDPNGHSRPRSATPTSRADRDGRTTNRGSRDGRTTSRAAGEKQM